MKKIIALTLVSLISTAQADQKAFLSLSARQSSVFEGRPSGKRREITKSHGRGLAVISALTLGALVDKVAHTTVHQTRELYVIKKPSPLLFPKVAGTGLISAYLFQELRHEYGPDAASGISIAITTLLYASASVLFKSSHVGIPLALGKGALIGANIALASITIDYILHEFFKKQ